MIDIWLIELDLDADITCESSWNVISIDYRIQYNINYILSKRKNNNWLTVGYADSFEEAQIVTDNLKDELKAGEK